MRWLMLVAAVAAIAFLGAGYTAARAEDELFRLQFLEPDAERARTLAGRAGRATAGERRVLLESTVRLRAGDAAGAVAMLRGAVEREPENAEAWLRLGTAAREVDPALSRRARQRLQELVPPVPPPP